MIILVKLVQRQTVQRHACTVPIWAVMIASSAHASLTSKSLVLLDEVNSVWGEKDSTFAQKSTNVQNPHRF